MLDVKTTWVATEVECPYELALYGPTLPCGQHQRWNGPPCRWFRVRKTYPPDEGCTDAQRTPCHDPSPQSRSLGYVASIADRATRLAGNDCSAATEA